MSQSRCILLTTLFLFLSFGTLNASADVFIDNGSAGTSSTGTWQVSSGSGYYGTNCLWSRNGATYTWQMSSQPSGIYEVFMWWATYPSRSTNAPVDIAHSAGTERVYINQQINGSQWNSLGQYYFNGSGSVRLTATDPSPTSYCADAVWFKLISANTPPVATIDSIIPSPALPGELVQFTGYGTDSDGSVTGFEWASDMDGILSNDSSFSASDLSEATHIISFRVQDNQGVWSAGVTEVLVVGEIPTEIIIDNSTANTSSTGTWETSGASGYYGINSLWSRNGTTYTWRFNPLQSGLYDISMWWTTWSSRSTNIPVTIQNSGPTATVYINQQQNGSRWNSLGEYFFEFGTTYNVTITSQPNPTSTSADAVRITLISANSSPTATIDSIAPNPAKPGENIQFTGHGTDSDGSVTGYEWQSNINGVLSDADSFSASDLSEGTHTISFRVQDNEGTWSAPATATLVIGNLLPVAYIDSIIPNPALPGENIQFTGHGTDGDGSVTGYEWQSDIDDVLSDANSFSVSDLSQGTHTISFRVQDDTGDWSAPATSTLVVGNNSPTAYIDSITPNPATTGQSVAFTGHGVDTDGTIAGYNWTSSRDGFLSDQASFSRTTLSVGQHTITFTVVDNRGAESAPVTMDLTVQTAPSNVEYIFACYVYAPGYGQGQFRSMLLDIGATQQGVQGESSEQWTYVTPQKTYIIKFPHSNAELINALKVEGAHILICGHSNYGLGPFFATNQEVSKQLVENLLYVDDDRILNVSTPWAHVSVSGMRTGQAYPHWWSNYKDGTSAIMPYDFNDPAGDPPYNYYLTYRVPGDPTYYKVETVRNSAVERFWEAGGGSGVPWYSPNGAVPNPDTPDHRQYYITNSTPWSPSFETVGNWTDGFQIGGTPAYFRENYIYSSAGDGENTAKWMFTIPYSGTYTIWAWWPASSSRSSQAPYTVNHASGSTTVPMNQTTNGQRWNRIGDYNFDANGSYSVILSNDVASGSVVADGLKITHIDNPPEVIQADFYTSPRTGPAPLEVEQFDNQSTGDYITWLWNFGDGVTNTTREDADHVYSRAGTYTVTLTVNGSGSLGSSTKTKTAYIIVGNNVTEPLRAEFSASSREGTVPRSVRFRDRSSNGVASWLWDFGDGNTSTAQSPTYVYTQPGNYTVSLTVTDADGLSATETKQNFVRAVVFEKILDNVDYPKRHIGSKVIVARKQLEVNPAEFRYARMLYSSCNSGNYYIDTFKRGIMFYTVGGSALSPDKAFAMYLQWYLEGQSDQYIWQRLQAFEAVWDYYDFTRPPPTQTMSMQPMSTQTATRRIARTVEPVQADTVKSLTPKEKRQLKRLRKMSLSKAFEKLKDVEFTTNETLMQEGIKIAFKRREAKAIALATNYVRLSIVRVVDDKLVNRSDEFNVAKKILQVYSDKAANGLLELYKTDNVVVKGNIIRVAGGMAGNPAMRNLLISALDDKTLCEDKNPEMAGEYLRICDLAYNELVLYYKVTDVLRTIGTGHRYETRDYHIDVLKTKL